MILQSPHDFCILILGQKSYDGRRETARVQSAFIGTPYRDIARAPYDRHLKCAETKRLPSDLVAILSENFDEACVYCYHRRRSTKTPTMYTLGRGMQPRYKPLHKHNVLVQWSHCLLITST